MLKRILIAGALLSGLLIYITQVELAGDRVKGEQEQPFAKLAPNAVKQIAIDSSVGGSFAIKNSAASKSEASEADEAGSILTDESIAKWGIEGIPQAKLDAGAVNGLFSAVRGLTLKDGITAADAGSDKSVYGLTTPALSIGITTASGTRTLRFGKQNEYVGQRYLSIDGDERLYLVPSTLFDAASKKQDDFRNRTPLMMAASNIKALELSKDLGSAQESKLRFERALHVVTGPGSWKLVVPGVYTASASAVDDAIAALRTARASSFIDGNVSDSAHVAKYGLAAPKLIAVLSLQLKPDAPASHTAVKFGAFKAGNGSDAYSMLIEGSDTIYTLDNDVTEKLWKSVDQYRERKLAHVSLYDVQSYTVARAGETPLVVKREREEGGITQWTVNGARGDTPFIEQFVADIGGIEAKSFLDPAAPAVVAALSTDQQVGSLEFKLSDGSTKTIFVGGEIAGERVVAVGEKAEPFTIAQMELNRLLPRAEALLDANKGSDASATSSIATDMAATGQ